MFAKPMGQKIKIKVISEPDDDGLYKYQISLSNSDTSATLDFWGYADNFREFADGLIDFPKSYKDTVTYELGKDKSDGEMKWAYYMLLQVFCFSPSGQTAIKVIVDNHADIPEYQRSEFYIKSDPATLNRLGQQLKSWTPDSEKELTLDF